MNFYKTNNAARKTAKKIKILALRYEINKFKNRNLKSIKVTKKSGHSNKADTNKKGKKYKTGK